MIFVLAFKMSQEFPTVSLDMTKLFSSFSSPHSRLDLNFKQAESKCRLPRSRDLDLGFVLRRVVCKYYGDRQDRQLALYTVYATKVQGIMRPFCLNAHRVTRT